MSVYFIQAGESGPVKIGQAKDWKSRLCDLQCSNAEPLRLINLLPGSFAEEGEAHRIFKAFRIRGEWFKFHHRMLSGDLDLSGAEKNVATTFPVFQQELPLPVPDIAIDESLVGWAHVLKKGDSSRAQSRQADGDGDGDNANRGLPPLFVPMRMVRRPSPYAWPEWRTYQASG